MACIRTDSSHWPKGRIPYEINSTDFPPGSSERTSVVSAITVWNDQTLLQLLPRGTEADFIEFVLASNSCSSPVGMQGGRQEVGCAVGAGWGTWSVVHEIGHAFGLWHEHTRLDRDNWVTVHWGNVKSGKEHNFQVDPSDRRDVCQYDYDSLMHYGRYGFAVDESKPTLTPTLQFVQIGQRDHLSVFDKKAVLFLHGTFSLRTELQNDGVSPEAGVAQVLPNGGSVREWIVCRTKQIEKIYATGGGGF